jgi:hypothetical protein
MGVEVGVYLPPISLASLALLPAAVVHRGGMAKVDMCVAFAVCFAAILAYSQMMSFGTWGAMVAQWGPAYVVARTVAVKAGVRWSTGVLGWAMVLVAVLAVIEFFAVWHPFAGLVGVNPAEQPWAALQIRGAQVRSEWAFGHAIALGAALAASIPLVMTSAVKPKWSTFGVLALACGLAVSLSRGPLLAGALAVPLTLWTTRSMTTRSKMWWLALTVLVAAVLIPKLQGVERLAGNELTTSTGYRTALFSTVLSDVNPIGAARNVHLGRGFNYRGYDSVDNAFLAIALTSGWLLAGALFSALLAVVVRVLRRRASALEVALAAQIPVLFTVAFITQYAVIIFFLFGLAVSAVAIDRETARRHRPDRQYFRAPF